MTLAEFELRAYAYRPLARFLSYGGANSCDIARNCVYHVRVRSRGGNRVPSKSCISGGSRKVRAPQGMVLVNGQGEQSHGKCHRKYTAGVRLGKGEMVR